MKKWLKKIWKSRLFCILFHTPINKKETWHYDKITRRWFGKYECPVCKKKFVARHKKDWFRLYKKEYKKIKKGI